MNTELPKNDRKRGFNWFELVLLIGSLLVFLLGLASLALPAVGTGLVKALIGETLSNYRQLFMLTQSSSLDAGKANSTNKGFPADCGDTMKTWSNGLVPNYASSKSFSNLLAVRGSISNTFVYNVGTNNSPNTVFITRANLNSNGLSNKPPYFLEGGALVTIGGEALTVTGANTTALTNCIWPSTPQLK